MRICMQTFVDILQDIVVPESKNGPAVGFETAGALAIIRFISPTRGEIGNLWRSISPETDRVCRNNA
jgi:hypothetical protein